MVLLSANAISLLGTAVTLVAVPWYVLSTTGSPAAVGLVGACTVLSEVVSGFAGGAIVDRLGHKRTSIMADLGSAVAVAAVPALNATVGLAYWQLVVLVSVRALFDTPGTAGRWSLVPELARAARVGLDRVNTVNNFIFRGSALVGAPLAGLLIVLMSPPNLLWLDAASFACSAVLVATGVPARLLGASAPVGRGYAHDLLAGLRYVVRDPLILSIAVAVAVANFLDTPLIPVLLPVLAREQYGSPVALGLLVSAAAGGHLAGLLLYGVLGRRLSRYLVYMLAWSGVALALLGLALAPNVAAAAAALLAMGLVAAPINPIISTTLMERVPLEMRARVIAPTRALAFMAAPLGLVTVGLALQSVPVQQVVIVLAGAYGLVVFGSWLNPALRNIAPAAREPGRDVGG